MAHRGPRDRDSNSNLDAPLGEQARPAEPLQSPLGDLLVSVGFLALVLPLFFHLTVEKTAIADGATTTRVVDYVAICGGVLADLCGSLLLVKALTGRNAPGGSSKAQVRGAMALLISALGLMHLLRGLGLIKLGLLG
jgi:hypothetical protein